MKAISNARTYVDTSFCLSRAFSAAAPHSKYPTQSSSNGESPLSGNRFSIVVIVYILVSNVTDVYLSAHNLNFHNQACASHTI